MSDLPKNYNFIETEEKWQRFWKDHQIYRWNSKIHRNDSFVIDTPPPTVSGSLHIGHVYSYTQTDFIARFQRMLGKNVFYPIGFDDNGLPTERLVEKYKNVKAANVERQEFIKVCQEVVSDEEEKFRRLFNKIALSVDWNLEYQTINAQSQKISQMSFLDLIEKGEIYRDDQPVLWDTIDQTALAQADIVDKEKIGVMNDIIFHTTQGQQIIIATSRPEFIPSCVAIFYHPDDGRYQNLKNVYAITPLFGVRVPIIADEGVQQDKGTGLVMCCTFGDQMDTSWWKKHKLSTKIMCNKKGRIELQFSDFAADPLITDLINQLNGLKLEEAKAVIIEILKEKNLLVKQSEIVQSVKCAERSGSPLEILMTSQWFVRTIKHKSALLQRAQQLNWYPEIMKIKLESWINSIAWDWCISRQRYFGVPFPVWYSKRAGEEGKPLFATIDQLPVDPQKDLPKGYSRDEVEADVDVMDTWATSALTPQLSSWGVSDNLACDSERHQLLFPADLRSQAHEIIRTWAFYTILKAHLHQNTLPWKNIMISGWCLAHDRTKMSKSKGNNIIPENILAQYGTDVTRYWASTSKLGADTTYSEDVMRNGKKLVNKLWNAAKFISSHFNILSQEDRQGKLLDHQNKVNRIADQWLIVNTIMLADKFKTAMLNYEYARAMNSVEQFFMESLCDNYLEITKRRTYNESRDDNIGQYSAVLALYHSFEIILKLFAPFMPYITEEIYKSLYEGKSISIHERGTLQQSLTFNIDTNIKEFEYLVSILDCVRKFKADRQISIKSPIAAIEIEGSSLSDDLINDLKNVASIDSIQFVAALSSGDSIFTSTDFKINIKQY